MQPIVGKIWELRRPIFGPKAGLGSWPGREKKFSGQGTGPTRGPNRETSKHQAGKGQRQVGRARADSARKNWEGGRTGFSRNCSQRAIRERRGEIEAIHLVLSSSRRGRAAMVVHTAHAFHDPMPPTAPRPLWPRSPVAPMLDLTCTAHSCRLTHARSPAYTVRSPAIPHIAHAAHLHQPLPGYPPYRSCRPRFPC
jgi:hypothetical protein